MPIPLTDLKVIVASDIGERDGIGVEIYFKDKLLIEVFRDDTKKTREVTFYEKNLALEVVEEAISIFKREIPWEFQD